MISAFCGLAAAADAPSAAGWTDDAWRCVFERFYVPKMHLVYDYRIDGAEDGLVRCLPTVDEIRDGFPNPCGWGTGMEDSVLVGAPLLLAAMRRFDAFMASFDGFRFNRPNAPVLALLAYWARRAGAAKR